MTKFIFKDVESIDVASIDAHNESDARLRLGGTWMEGRRAVLMTHAEARSLHDETVAAITAQQGTTAWKGRNHSVEEMSDNHESTLRGEKLKALRHELARIIASL